MAAPEPEEGFKVTDRRRRPEAVDSPVPPREAETTPRPATPPGPAPSTAGARSAGQSLVGLFLTLAGSAAMAMGEMADPATGQRHVDLDQAADVIDLLMLLREKTEGHRTAEETQTLDSLLYDLQLRFVSVRKRSG